MVTYNRAAVKTRLQCGRTPLALTLTVLVGGFVPVSSHAFEFDTGNPDLRVRWDNSLKYSSAWRTKDPSSKLTEGQAALNQDDGDRNFNKGLISSRLDLLSEFDVTYGDVGARVSGAAWYDDVYNRGTDNNDPSRANSYSVNYDEFPDATRKLHGRKGELLDAFVFGKTEVADMQLSGRLGQYGMQWGESLFYGVNGIAGGMAPIDIVKAQSVPNSQFKELIRPTQQVSGQLQLTPDVSIGAYYKLEWEANRFPSEGSYFSASDTFGDAGERLFIGAPVIPGGQPLAFFHGKDKDAKDSGQGGVQLRWRTDAVDWGFYAIRFHSQSPQLNVRPNLAGLNPQTGKAGEYYWVYPEGIEAFGTSFSTTIDSFNVAGEVSTRWNQPLASTRQRTLAVGEAINNNDDPLYATGRTLHANVSWLASLEPNFLVPESSFLGEIAWNRVMSVTKNRAAIDPQADRDAASLRLVYEPMYRQFMPGLDLSVPMGASYTNGSSEALGPGFGVDHGGDMNIGFKGNYLNVWNLGLTYTHYYGPEGTSINSSSQYSYRQALKDRDYLAFTVSRTF